MNRKKIIVFLGIGALCTQLLTGCAQTKDSEILQESTVVADEKEKEEETIFVKVTALEGNTITGETGEIVEGNKPEGEKPEGNKPEGGMPEGDKPEGEKPEGDKPEGEKPEGDKPEGGMPEGNFQEKEFTSNGETVTLEITENTQITIEFLQGTEEGSIDNISVGSILEVSMDENNQAEHITIKNMQAGNGFGGSMEVTNGTSANTINEDTAIDGETFSSTGDDENALRIDQAKAELNQITIEKTAGESSNTENGDFYGQNAGLLALNGANVSIQNAKINTAVKNGNGVFCYGEGTTVTIADSEIYTEKNNSGGIQTTGGGTMNASNLTVETMGDSAAAIRSDRGGGIVTVTKGSYTTNGTGSPAVYSTADITVSDAILTANASEGIVVEGKNSVKLYQCDLTGNMKSTDESENVHGVMIYQSMSGDAAMGEANFTAEGGSITTKAGDLFYVTNTDCQISLKNVQCTLANENFLRIEGNESKRGWGTKGANGGKVVFTAQNQKIEGNIIVDDISTLSANLEDGTSLRGTINNENSSGEISVVLDNTSNWTLTGDSYVSSFYGELDNVAANGYHLYVNGECVL